MKSIHVATATFLYLRFGVSSIDLDKQQQEEDDVVGVNFAVAGATAIEHDFFARNNLSIDVTPQSILTELVWFDDHLRRSNRSNAADALFWVGEIGANDYAYTVVARDTLPPKLVRTMAVQRVTTFVEVRTLYYSTY